MKVLQKFSFIFFLFMALGCEEINSQIESYNSEDKKLFIKVEKSENISEIANILTERFHEFPVSIFSKLKTNIKSDEIEFIFIKGAPNKKLAEYLVTKKGRFIAKEENGIIWFTSKNIISANSSHADGLYYLDLRMDKNSGKRIYKLSSGNVGKIVDIYFDDKYLTSVKMSSAINETIRIQVDTNAKELRLIAAILRSGSIQSDINIVNNEI